MKLYTKSDTTAYKPFRTKFPPDHATIFVEAQKQAGEWRFERAEVAVEGQQQRIDLLTP